MSFKRNIKIIQSLSIYSVIFLNIINNTEAFTVSMPQYTSTSTVQSSQPQGLPQQSQQNSANLTQGYINTSSNIMGVNNTTQPSSTSYWNTFSTNTLPQYGIGINTMQYNSTSNQNNNAATINISTNTNSRVYSKSRDKSCQMAYAQSNGSYVLDLSDTYDVNNYGSTIIQDFCNKAKQSNYDFVYIDLCNTDVHPMLVAQWNQILKQNNIQVMWNLSNNSSVDDNTIVSLGSLDNIKGLNISNTNVSSQGIMMLYQLLMNSIDSTIQFINICGINIDQMVKNQLTNAFNQHIALWKQKNSGKEYTVFKNGVIDSYNDANNYLINSGFNYINTGMNFFNTGSVQYSKNNLGYTSSSIQTQLPLFGQQTISQPSYISQPTIGQNTFTQQLYNPQTQLLGQQMQMPQQYSTQIPQQYGNMQLQGVYY